MQILIIFQKMSRACGSSKGTRSEQTEKIETEPMRARSSGELSKDKAGRTPSFGKSKPNRMALAKRKEHKFFDSADWAMKKESSAPKAERLKTTEVLNRMKHRPPDMTPLSVATE
jgi:hypothetical protein